MGFVGQLLLFFFGGGVRTKPRPTPVQIMYYNYGNCFVAEFIVYDPKQVSDDCPCMCTWSS